MTDNSQKDSLHAPFPKDDPTYKYNDVQIVATVSMFTQHRRTAQTNKKLYVATWCPVCDKRVSNRGKDTSGLLAHIRKSHPKRSNQYLIQETGESKVTPKQTSASKCIDTTDSNTRKTEQRKIYATRVDTWKSHDEKKLCPRCQKEAIPTLHARGDKLTTSHIGALCLLGCWPLCFVPLIMKRSKKVRMICPLCGYMYGSFQYNNTGLAPCKTDSEDSQARLSSPPRSFRLYAAKQKHKN